jgi:hypothetical protein
MKLRQEQKELIAEEVRSQIAEQINIFQPHGWRRLVRLLRDLGPVIASVSFVLALVVAVITLALFATNKVSQEGEFRGTTGTRLNSIETRLTKIENRLDLLPAQIALSKLKDVPKTKLKEHQDELTSLKNTLGAVPRNTPDFWPTSFEVIRLLSLATSYIENPKSTETTIENTSGIRIIKNGDTVVLKGRVQNSTFENSVIRFDPSVELRNVTFRNCVFILPEQLTPSTPLQRIGSALLTASNIADVSITGS